MSVPSPLSQLHAEGEGLAAPYGPALATGSIVELVEAFDPVQIEYAAIRTHAAIFDQPHRATLAVLGPDRIDFLNRMLTQQLKDLSPLTCVNSFWLSRKGRIDADLRLVDLPALDGSPAVTLIDCDIHAAPRVLSGLGAYIITEDCSIEDWTNRFHRLALHGPASAALLAGQSAPADGLTTLLTDMQPGQARIATMGAARVVIDRRDLTGEMGLELLVPNEHAGSVYEALSTPWSARERGGVTPSTDRARRIGWHALNIARVEAGWPLYYADFGPDSLPHEAGERVLHDRVSFKKGCYLGQEIVARMDALGHPKQRLVPLKIHSDISSTRTSTALGSTTPQAVTGSPVLASLDATAQPVGAVTSSVSSPMLGDKPIAFAMVKWAHTQPGTTLHIDAGGPRLAAVVADKFQFWSR